MNYEGSEEEEEEDDDDDIGLVDGRPRVRDLGSCFQYKRIISKS